MDARSSHGAWTRRFLKLIAASPGRRAADLAASIGWDVPTFKAHVRKLKTLGLTESLEVGYRLSPRGADLLRGLR
jgi:predicted transcriptional regulator